MTIVLCRLDQLDDPGAAAFLLPSPQGPLPVLAIRRGGQVRAYRNACPHAGHPLEWLPRAIAGGSLLCPSHHALFREEDGFCLGGPCAGQQLAALHLILKYGVISVELPPFTV